MGWLKNRKQKRQTETKWDGKEVISIECGDLIKELNSVLKENMTLPALRYFTDLIYGWYQSLFRTDGEKQVLLLGTGVPAELIHAVGIRPVRILGGSRDACMWSDELVPRDLDPVSRSLLGYTHAFIRPGPDHYLYIVPVGCDSMRKIVFFLIREGKKVCVVDVPPERTDPYAQEKWVQQMIRMTGEVEVHTGKRVSAFSLRRAAREMASAREALTWFIRMASDNRDVLTAAGQILVQNSLFYAEDIEEWILQVNALTKDIKELGMRKPRFGDRRPRVLLAGSPMYFPNMKVPRLIGECGLDVCMNLDASMTGIDVVPRLGGAGSSIDRIIGRVAMNWYQNDGGSFYTKNEVMREKILETACSGQIDGVVYHILKGQIEPDFELEKMEAELESLGIPVFRLETDYQFQDVEQLRIRMEAFSEMLVHNSVKKGRRMYVRA